jgi:type II secretory pathway pseudopilin PulG
MYLEGQGCSGPKRVSSRPHTRFDDGGFTMVVLLVVMAVMAVGMTAMLPTWRQQAIREKEEELIFRGNQYARALVLYSRKNNNLLPANIDVLYEGKYLRKKWKDPITNADFGLLPAGQPANAGRGAPQGPGAPAGGRSGGAPAPQTPQGGRGASPFTTGRSGRCAWTRWARWRTRRGHAHSWWWPRRRAAGCTARRRTSSPTRTRRPRRALISLRLIRGRARSRRESVRASAGTVRWCGSDVRDWSAAPHTHPAPSQSKETCP